jgi:hypothetical protein
MGGGIHFVYGVPATVDARDVLIVPSINRNAPTLSHNSSEINQRILRAPLSLNYGMA